MGKTATTPDVVGDPSLKAEIFMNIFNRLFGKKAENDKPEFQNQAQKIKNEKEATQLVPSPEKTQEKQPLKQKENEPVEKGKTSGQPNPDKRSIRVFVSSTFRDMIDDRNQLMTHCLPELRRLCLDRQLRH